MPEPKDPKGPQSAGSNRILRAGAIPEGILAALEAAGARRETALAAVPADLSPEGKFAKRWLVVARDRVAVVDLPAADGGSPKVGSQEPFKGLTALDYRAMVGGGVLLAKRGEAQRELLRCSRAADRAVQGVLGKLRLHLWPELPEDKDKAKDKKKEEPKPADAAKPEGAEQPKDKDKEKEKEKEKPPREALPELTADAARVFLDQLDDLRVQLYCRKCGVPFKEDSQVCPLCINPGRTLLRVLKLARPYKKYLVHLSVIMVAGTLLGLVPPYIYKQLFDKALVPKEPTPDSERIVFLFLCIGAWVGVELVGVALRVFRGRTSVLIGASISRDLRGRTFNHLQLLSLGYFDRHKTGALMSRVSGDAQHLEGFLVDGVLWTAISILQAVGVTCVLFAVNWKMALLVLLPAPLVILVTKLIWRRIMSRYRRLWEVISRLSAALNDSLRGVRVVKSFGREEQEIARFDRYNQASRTAMITAEQTWTTLVPFIQFVMNLGVYLVWALGGFMIIKGLENTTPGTLVMFLGYTPMLYGPLHNLTQANQWFTRSMTAAERIFEILDTEPEVAEAADSVPMPRIAGRIELRNVTFGYEKHTPVLKHATLDIAAGEMIGLVGASGAGKTTTVNLISRLYDVDQGQLFIDGVDVRKIRVEDLRRQIGVVLQETYLFSGTVFENIAYAKPSAGREEVIAAARLANAHGFIMDRPDGYDSEVEEGGNNFSGGEKQRLAIARAILHDPRILILDEATSSVDTKTEQEIQQAITRLTAGRTTFAIAHRLSTLRGASRLVVLEKGEIKDVGSHEELSAREGIYRDLVKAHAEMCSVVAVEG